MTLLVDLPSTGLEAIQRCALMVLFSTLNDAIASVEEAWNTSDEDMATLLGRPYIPTELEVVENDNFHEGFRPSLINAPIEGYPNVAVMAYQATPAPGGELYDHQEKFRCTLVVETMVKATEEEGEELLDRRAHRMVEAVQVCLSANPTLGGIVSGFEGSPTTRVTEMFTRKDRGGNSSARDRSSYGSTFLWQGGRIEYAVRKEASMPAINGSSFRSAPNYDGLDIDQPL